MTKTATAPKKNDTRKLSVEMDPLLITAIQLRKTFTGASMQEMLTSIVQREFASEIKTVQAQAKTRA